MTTEKTPETYKKLKILYISQYFPPEMGAPSARIHELSRRWVAQGHQVTVITGFPNHPTGIIPENYSQHIYKQEELDGIRLIRTYIFPTANKGFIKRILSYLSFMLSSVLLGAWRSGRPDVIVATSPQFFVGVAGYLMSLVKWRPFIFEVRDLWPESIVQLGMLKNKMAIRILEYIEVFLYRRARGIIVVAESSIPILNRKGIASSKIDVVKNGVDLQLFDVAKTGQGVRRQIQLDSKIVVSYIGTHGLSHALDKVIECAALMHDEPKIQFLLIGEGAEKENLQQQAKALGLRNVTFLNQVDKQVLPNYYAASDLVLVTLRDLELFRCVIPSKIFEIMAMARPIIISVDGEAREIIERADAGVFIEPENPQALRSAILAFQKDPDVLLAKGRNGRRFVETSFNRQKLADQFLQYIQKRL